MSAAFGWGRGNIPTKIDPSTGDGAPNLPTPGFAVGVTGHRASHPSFPDDPAPLRTVLDGILTEVDRTLKDTELAGRGAETCATRLLTLLADGTDHQAADLALAREWELVIPLPFGARLNLAINANAGDPETARAILAGQPVDDPAVAARVASIAGLADQGRLFELADNDDRIAHLLIEALARPHDQAAQGVFAAESGRRAALAGQILIEQSDLIIAVWDGQSTANVGGTGHTALVALELGSPVIWIDPRQPEAWKILTSPEDLFCAQPDLGQGKVADHLRQLIVQSVSLSAGSDSQPKSEHSPLEQAPWRDRSTIASHAFRRIEAAFGETRIGRKFASVRQSYEHPTAIAEGSGKSLLDTIRALNPHDTTLADRIANQILRRFAWLDGVAAHLSDRHRSGMIINFLLGASAIIVGVLYLPLVDAAHKWIFAGAELFLLLLIVWNTARGRALRLHSRWFETRRAAEYLRHSPILSALGVARPCGAWPEGANSRWPEWYARHVSRAVSLPEARVDQAYLRAGLTALRDHHVDPQRQYHARKSEHLARVHHGLDHLSERLFLGAVVLVGIYLALTLGTYLGWVDPKLTYASAKWFTVLAVALPTLGGAFAGIRYFGDFERFAEISQTTASKLDAVAARIETILSAPACDITYDRVTDIVRATDQIVFDEIQNWQAVFSSKVISVPA